MLRAEENERLVRVGPGTPAGELFRRYWQPAALSTELAERDGPPVRVRLLGEDLVAFRASDGRVGLVDAYCRHRRAPLFFGRNEDCGLRCVYHGWKFDVTGKCVDMPSEPADSPLKEGATLKAYPTCERGGVVWAYLGPTALRPGEPDFEWTRAPASHRTISKSFEAANYLQALEGGLDTTHVSFLHNNKLGDRSNYFVRDGAPKIEVFETPYGYNYVSHRKFDDERNFVRLYQYIMPFQQMRPNIVFSNVNNDAKVPRYDGHIWVPLDDETTHVYNFMCGSDANCALDPDYVETIEAGYGRGRDDYVTGTFRLKASLENDYFIDRQMQKTQTFTGIKGINTQDMATQEGMGPVVDRSREYLGTSDRAIVVMRKLLLDATAAVERGESPRGADAASYRGVRPYDAVLPAAADWRQYFAEHAEARW
jgi:phenylpropionate dioxygenase-like ring-hydroxylating dioxygenase large terminal subunit